MMQNPTPSSESIQTTGKTAISDAKSNIGETQTPRIVDILDSEYRGISLYAVSMLLLVIAILWTGISVVEQIQTYHHSYNQLSKLKRDFRQLQIEHQRMMIEQQTFSGTPQVTSRAATELNMFYPNFSDRMIIHANGVVTKPPTATNSQATHVASAVETMPSTTYDTPSNTVANLPVPETQH